MTLAITINLDNAAFGDGEYGRGSARHAEVAEILRKWLERSDMADGDSDKLRDSNGNTVGAAVIVATL